MAATTIVNCGIDMQRSVTITRSYASSILEPTETEILLILEDLSNGHNSRPEIGKFSLSDLQARVLHHARGTKDKRRGSAKSVAVTKK